MEKKVKKIKRQDTLEFILNIHYAKRIPQIIHSFGLFVNNDLKGIVTFGSPPAQNVCKCICGDNYKSEVIELNRLVLKDNQKNYASFLISNSIKLLPKPTIIISYADLNFNHNGYIYQATNFIYTGKGKAREKFIDKNGKDINERSLAHKYQKLKIPRSEYLKLHNITLTTQLAKHRYVYIHANKKDKKQRLKDFKLPIKPYPKGNNQNYVWNYKPKTQGLLF